MKPRTFALLWAILAASLVPNSTEAQPAITTQPTNQTVFIGNTAILSVAVSGTGPFSYQWRFDGSNVTQVPVITTVAGGGIGGDGAAATNAELYYPYDVSVDASGNLFIADNNTARIRKVGTNGIITTLAGNGAVGYSGDGGLAADAELDFPTSVAVDSAGNVFIADSGNSRVRKVGTNGIISTVAGNGAIGYSGDGGAAPSAALAYPRGVAVDPAGNLFIADTYNNRIRRVGTNGVITTVAGNGAQNYSGDGAAATSAELYNPCGVAVDASGNLFIADTFNERIRKVANTGLISTVAGNGAYVFSGDGGAATTAELNEPNGVAVDAFGNVFIADTDNYRIRKVDINGIITTVAGNGTNSGSGDGGAATNAGLANIYGVAVHGYDNLFIADAGYNRILKVTSSSPTLTLSNTTTANSGRYTVVVTSPYGSVTSSVAALAVVIPPPPIIVTQPTNQTVLFGSSAMFGVAVAGIGPFNYQWRFEDSSIAPQNNTQVPFIATVAGSSITGGFSGDGGVATNAGLFDPAVATVDAFGNLFIADTYNNRIRKVGFNGIITTLAGNGAKGYLGDRGIATSAELYYPDGVALDASGDLFIADYGNDRIRKVGLNGVITTVAGGGTGNYLGDGDAATNATLNSPGGVAVDASGDVFIADTGNQRIRKLGPDGIISTVAGNGVAGYSGDDGAATTAELDHPSGVAVDGFGNLFIADAYNNRIRKVGANGVISTVAGNGHGGYSGDGAVPASAELWTPSCVAVDGSGNLFIADTDNNRIRKVVANGIITTVAGNGTYGYSGDGGAAIDAELAKPYGVAVDPFGNLFIADSGSSRVRKVTTTFPILMLGNTTTANSGSYTVIVTSPYGSVTSAVATLLVLTPPSILVQPASQVALANRSATFSVMAAGTAPLYCSWYFNATNLLQSGTNTALLLTNVSAVDAGNYTVLITNAAGSATSQVAALTVVFPVSVTTQPTDQTAFFGNSATFSVAVRGSGPFSFQWQCDGTNITAQAPTITTVAGNGQAGYFGDGAAATSAELSGPIGVAVDASGSLFIADSSNNRIRKVGTEGIITSVAGNGGYGFSGDSGLATSAELSGPAGVAVDASGALFIADFGNSRVRKVATDGVITTVAGSGASGYSGDGGMATNAALSSPWGVALDIAGNALLGDEGNNRVRKVGTNGVITTVAGNGTSGYSGDGGAAISAQLNHSRGVAVDNAGDLFIADYANNRIRRVGTNGIINTVAGSGLYGYSGDGSAATQAELSTLWGVAVDAFGNVFVADTGNNRVRKVGTDGVITTIAGNGGAGYSGDGGAATDCELSEPLGVALDAAGNLFVADYRNNRIRKVGANGIIATVAGVGADGYGTLTLSPVTTSSSGSYTVIVSSPYGSVTSGVAALTVMLYPPTIATQPTSAIAATGSDPQFSVAARGSLLSYQWFLNGTQVPGATNSALVLYDVATNQAGSYAVVITNAVGSVTSAPALLSVYDPPVIVSQTPDTATAYGFTTTFSVAATGYQPQYQWLFNGDAMAGATNSSLALADVGDANSGTYSVVVTNLVGAVTSAPILLSVYTAVRILPAGSWQGVGYWPDFKMVYTIEAGPQTGTIVYAVEEQVSSLTNSTGGTFVVSDISDGGTYDTVNGLIKFGPFFDQIPRVLTYELTPPSEATNSVQFAGVISIDSTNYAVAGDSEIDLLPLHPADNDPPINNSININDVTAYAKAWKVGAAWPVEPNPIPIEYLTSAGLIWKRGEYYIYDSSLGAPPACWVNVTSPSLSPMLRTHDPPDLAVCSMPTQYTAGVPFTVTLTITPSNNVVAYAVEDQVPTSWTATNFTPAGTAVFDAINNRVKWGPFLDNEGRTLTYQITPPTNASGIATFSGIASFDGFGVPITGVRQVSNAAAATLSTGAFLRTNGFQINLVGSLGVSYILQASTNLSTWISLQTNINNSGTLEFLDPQATNFNYRFYRAVAP